MKRILFAFMAACLLPSCPATQQPADTPTPAPETPSNLPPVGENQVRVTLNWMPTDNFAGKMHAYDLKPQSTAKLWEMKSVASLQDTPAGITIDGPMILRRGERKRFVLAMHNTSQNPWFFFAAPHAIDPPEHSLGFKFKCLCINHAFTIPAGEVWYRVVELRVSKGIVAKEVSIAHAIIGISEKMAKNFKMPGGAHAMDDDE